MSEAATVATMAGLSGLLICMIALYVMERIERKFWEADSDRLFRQRNEAWERLNKTNSAISTLKDQIAQINSQ